MENHGDDKTAEPLTWLNDYKQVRRYTEQLVQLWDMDADRAWDVAGDRDGVNVGLISAYVAHCVYLTRGVHSLYDAGLAFAATPLVRSTMECSVTAVWLSLSPDKTMDFVRGSAVNRRKLLNSLVEHGMTGEPGLSQITESLERLEGRNHREGSVLRDRFEAVEGGANLFVTYRALSAYTHPTDSLANLYTEVVDQSDDNPWGLVLGNTPEDDLADNWLGLQAFLLLRAQIAADSVLVEPRHKAQLQKAAEEMGVMYTSRLVERP